MDFRQTIGELLDHYGGPEEVAVRLGVSQATVLRWQRGIGQPQPSLESAVRRTFLALQDSPEYVDGREDGWLLLAPEQALRRGVSMTLRDIREALHRRGRLSSRNEALDEIAKLLLAHVGDVSDGGAGLSLDALTASGFSREEAPRFLREFSARAVARRLPQSLAHEMAPQEFQLRIKDQEIDLAVEVLNAFQHLGQATRAAGNADERSEVDLLNDVFGSFLANSYADERELGQYLTPEEVVRFMVRLAIAEMTPEEFDVIVDPARCVAGGYVLDPSCGVASFLTEFLRTLRREVRARFGEEGEGIWLRNMLGSVLIGIDKSERMLRLAMTSMALFGAPVANLHMANALSRDGTDAAVGRLLEGRTRLIMTNPPFGAEFAWPDIAPYRIASSWARRSPGKIDSELLFMERYLDWLEDDGQLLVIVPDSVLTNRNLYEDLRTGMGPVVEIRSVTSLPAVTFAAAGTSTKTSVLHLRKRLASSRRGVTFFAICRDIGYTVSTRGSQKKKVHAGTNELSDLLDQFSTKSAAAGRSKWTTIESSDRWDATFEILRPNGRQAGSTQPALRVRDVAVLAIDKEDPRRRQNEDFPYIEISDVDAATCSVRSKLVPCIEAPSRARKRVRDGDVLVSTVRPERRTVGVVGAEEDGAVCTTGFAVLRPNGLDSLVLARLLQTDAVNVQLMRHNVGIAYPAIKEECLLDVVLPLNSQTLGGLVEEATKVRGLRAELLLAEEVFVQSLRRAIHEDGGEA